MGLTYEYTDSREHLETIEWDRYWIQNARDNKCSRIWIIGDSISNGIMETLNDLMHWDWPADGYVSSKGIDNPYLLPMIRMFGEQEGHRNVIIFNNGLHGFHLDDRTQYAEYYEKAVCFLLETYQNTPLFLSLCTPVADPKRDVRVMSRNDVIRAVAKKYNLPVIDYYTILKNDPSLYSKDGVHLTNYRPLCHELIRNIETYM